MSDPFTLAAIAVGASVAGGAVGAAGSIKSGNAAYQAGYYQAAVAENNAKISEKNAEEAIAQGRVAEQLARRESAALRGQQRAVLAGLGQMLDVGTAGNIVSDTAEMGEVDALTIRRNAQREALGFHLQAQDFRNEAQLSRMGASSARTAGFYGAAGSILGGVSGAVNSASRFPSVGRSGATLRSAYPSWTMGG